MSYKIEVSIVKTIQLRTTYPSYGGTKDWHKNERYRIPSVAADHYVRNRLMEWQRVRFNEDQFGAAYHRMTDAENEYKRLLSERYYRFVLKSFKEMLK